ncbi:hypothetical protein [Bradyrhizobium sp.]|uniref:hypothetical protein n=1 Tax=Bradyrhizobium sp. TaxID=376 RepID=UPI003C74E867
MAAPPNAISQGSNGAGGGALTAFRGKSAARAEPAIANTAAAKTNFFIKVPIQTSNSASDRTAAEFVNPGGNLVWVAQSTKQKMYLSAYFLCVIGII